MGEPPRAVLQCSRCTCVGGVVGQVILAVAPMNAGGSPTHYSRGRYHKLLHHRSSYFESVVVAWSNFTFCVRPRYALLPQVVAALDPSGALFGSRIVSRCDSKLRHKQAAWLHRALKDDSMMVIGASSSSGRWRAMRRLRGAAGGCVYARGSTIRAGAGTVVAERR